MHKKLTLPQKVCPVCQRPFVWRKKWRNNWESVIYCSKACRGKGSRLIGQIQRLMVTGNFALLAGIDPDQLDFWYLGIYIDAIEWVELPNTRGMSQFADGGIMA